MLLNVKPLPHPVALLAYSFYKDVDSTLLLPLQRG